MSSAAEPLLLVVGDWYGQGGLQRQLGDLVEQWPDRSVTVLTWRRGWRPRRRRAGRVTVFALPALQRWSVELGSGRARLNTGIAVVGGVLAALISRRRWRVAYAAGLHPEGTVAVIGAAPWRRRVVACTWLTGPLGNVARLQQAATPSLVRRAVGRAHWLVADTQEAADELIEAGFSPTRVRIVPGGIDLERHKPASTQERAAARRSLGLAGGASIIACCCRLDLRQKRLDVLFEAWAAARRPGWQLVVAGDGPDQRLVEQLADRAGVTLLGWVGDARLVWRAADAFAFPTAAETTGLALVEAMATGLTGVVSALPTFVQRKPDGVRLISNKVSAWAQALGSIMDADQDVRRAEGARARLWAQGAHDVRSTAAALAALLDSEGG